MKRAFRSLILIISGIRLAPHIVIMMVGPRRALIDADLRQWGRQSFGGEPQTVTERIALFVRAMTDLPELRNIFYLRAGPLGRLVSPLCPPLSTLYLWTKDIGPGLFVQHGFSTIVAARKIGANCHINQQVTIGFSNATDCPTIGDNVSIHAGAKVIGGVTIGDNVKVGANAVVTKDVPPNVTVVGVPAYIVRRDGARVHEPL